MRIPPPPKTTAPDYENTPICRNHALFFHALHPAVQLFGPIFFIAASAILTQAIRSITPGVGDKATSTANPTINVESSATSIPDPLAMAVDDSPPPYQAPGIEATTPAASPATPAALKVKRSSAHLFVLGTSAFLAVLFSFFCLALIIQYWTFCDAGSPAGAVARVFFWAVYCIPALWATTGASCWAMLLRDLWGPKATKRWQFEETALLTVLGYAVVAVPAGLVMAVGSGAVWAVERCQSRWCGDALEEEEEDGEDGVEAEVVELEEGLRGADGNGEGSASSSVEQETVGLIVGMEK